MNFARCPEEQNLEVFIFEGSFYFRTILRVAPGEELLVWPTEGLSKKLRLPKFVVPRNDQRKRSFFVTAVFTSFLAC